MMNDYPIGLPVDELETPILCLDAAALERNIARMAAFFQGRPAKLRPHSKTHKCPTIAWMQLRAGAIGITCAKLGEAEVMARAGIRDILIANQIVGADKIARLVSLAAYTNIIVAVDDPGNAAAISVAAQAKGVCVNVLVEVNVGMNRCGVEPGQPTLALAQQLVTLPGLRLRGIMGYEGHVVMLADAAARRRAAQEAMQQLIATRDLLLQHGLPVEIVSGGGSGTHDTTGDYAGVTEIQAGSYATMDARYKEVGLPFELALTVVARVISVPKPNSAVIDAGLKTLSTDFGAPRLLRPRGWTLQHLSEEHGSLHCEDGAPLKRGDRVEIVPSHGCTTINLHDAYYVTRDGKLEAVWPIAGRGRVR
jgi:D-serine deaminase-like pyridoxal phosphate-dependent protein